MAKPELGNKHQCLSCGTKFYDLGKTEIACPKCDEPFVPEVVATRATRAPKAPAPAPVPAPAPEPEPEVKTEAAEPVRDEAAVEIISLEDADAQNADTQDEDLAALKEADVDVDSDDDDSSSSEGEVDNTFLETDDDADPNVSDLIGGGISKEPES